MSFTQHHLPLLHPPQDVYPDITYKTGQKQLKCLIWRVWLDKLQYIH